MNTTIALVGRPNVGKSRLFNRLLRKRCSIVHDQPGVTRDIIAEPLDDNVMLLDTGGLGLTASTEKNEITQAVENQVSFAIQSADIVLFIVDARVGCLPLDYEIADRLRKANKTIVLVANKVDSERDTDRIDSFHALGLGDPIAISAEHGYGESKLRELLAKFQKQTADTTAEKAIDVHKIRFCLVGKPNVGKSSLANAFLKEQRFIESPIAGTTRDAVACDFCYMYEGEEYTFRLVDTAGLRAKKKFNSSVEFFSSVRTKDAIAQSDLVFFVTDALTGLTRQDKKLIHQCLVQGKCLILVINKWDLAYESIKEKKIDRYSSITDFKKQFTEALYRTLSESAKIPICFVSAKTHFSVHTLLEEGICLWKRAQQKIATPKLNRALQNLIEQQPPAFVLGKRFKIYYGVQSGNFPTRLKVFCNRQQRLTDSYQRYLEGGIRNVFDLQGCPLEFEFIGKERRYSEKTA